MGSQRPPSTIDPITHLSCSCRIRGQDSGPFVFVRRRDCTPVNRDAIWPISVTVVWELTSRGPIIHLPAISRRGRRRRREAFGSVVYCFFFLAPLIRQHFLMCEELWFSSISSVIFENNSAFKSYWSVVFYNTCIQIQVRFIFARIPIDVKLQPFDVQH